MPRRLPVALALASSFAVAAFLACGDSPGGSGTAVDPGSPDGATLPDGASIEPDGAILTPASCGSAADGWTGVIAAADAPPVTANARFVWTGTELLAIGYPKRDAAVFTVARYDLATKTWTDVPTTGAPGVREGFGMVLAGSRIFLFGGRTLEQNPYAGVVGDGYVLDLATRAWKAVSTTSAPSGRMEPSVAWTGSRVIVWNGVPNLTTPTYGTQSGALYDPESDTWSPMTPSPGSAGPVYKTPYSGVWAGSRFVSITGKLAYDPVLDGWKSVPSLNSYEVTAQVGFDGGALGLASTSPPAALVTCEDSDAGCVREDAGTQPTPRADVSGIVVGNKIVYYGRDAKGATGDAIAFDLATRTWAQFAKGGPAWSSPQLSWTGKELVVWAPTPRYGDNPLVGCVFTP